jgi:hypothetical protein
VAVTTGKTGRRKDGEMGGKTGRREDGETGMRRPSPSFRLPVFPSTRLPHRLTVSPSHRLAVSQFLRLHKRTHGVSALFDAILFFIIILSATGALYYWASAQTAATTDDLAARDLGRCAGEVQAAALGCDVGPVDYSLCGANRTFAGSAHECIRTMLQALHADAGCDIERLAGAVREVYGLLVETPLHYGLRATVADLGLDLTIAENAAEPFAPGAVRWTCAIPIIIGGAEGDLSLFLWR